MTKIEIFGTGPLGLFMDRTVDWPAWLRLPVAGDHLKVEGQRVLVDRVGFDIDEGQVKRVDVRVAFLD